MMMTMSTGFLRAVRWLPSILLLVLVSARVGAQPLPSLAPMLESVTPAVVNISTVTRVRVNNPYMNDPFFRRFFENERRNQGNSQSLGSGVIVDAERGIVVTNDHVINGADTILVTLADGREFDARLLGTDPDTDVAVLEIEADKLTALQWADSDALRVGDYSVAIGNPFGLGQTVTSGIVSALGRSGLGIQEFEDFIQTDASINPGNSGGALVSIDGKLIGINTAIVAPGGGNVGIGFAIPANLARDITEQIIETGRVQRGELGIAAQALTPQLAEAFDVDLNAGVIIRRVVPDSPADEAGLQVGDVIIAVNGRRVTDVAEVRNRIGLVRLGQRLQLQLMRDGELQELDAIVKEVQQTSALLSGASFIDARARDGRRFVALETVDADSALGRAGVRAGDVILSINRTPVASVDQMDQLASRTPDALLILVQRGRSTRYIQLGG